MGGGFTVDLSQKSSNLPPPKRTSWLLIVLTSTAVIGGFLFGYDTGIISGAMIIMRTQFRLNDIRQEMIVSATVGAAAVGTLLAGYFNQKFGRKLTILGSSVLFIFGSVVLAVSPTKAYLLIGRILLGIAIGVSSSTIPVYIAESAPPHIRGRMITMFQLQITFGFFCASLVAGALTYVEDNNVNWRVMLGLAAVPAALQLVGFFVMPESPRWLATNGQDEQAYDVLVRIYGGDELARQHADFELKLILENEEESQKEKDMLGAQNQPAILTMLRTPHLFKALIIGCSMQMFAQLSGINTVMYYSASIIMMSRVSSPSLAIWSNTILLSIRSTLCQILSKCPGRQIKCSLCGIIIFHRFKSKNLLFLCRCCDYKTSTPKSIRTHLRGTHRLPGTADSYIDSGDLGHEYRNDILAKMNECFGNSVTQEGAFPAGSLLYPVFVPNAPNYFNYGGMGSMTGHELTHDYDDQGRQYDADGNFIMWWSNETLAKFQEGSRCFVNEFSTIRDNVTNLTLNGGSSLGENIADDNSVRLAYKAFKLDQKTASSAPQNQKLQGFENFSPDQLFFLSFTQSWCATTRPEFTRNQILTNEHVPDQYKTNVPLQNNVDFATAFNCRLGTPMNPKLKCRIW